MIHGEAEGSARAPIYDARPSAAPRLNRPCSPNAPPPLAFRPSQVQIPAGILELIFWWILNPWWDLLMLTFFAYANALWQTCDACSLHNCPNSQGSGGKSSKCSCVDGKPTCGG